MQLEDKRIKQHYQECLCTYWKQTNKNMNNSYARRNACVVKSVKFSLLKKIYMYFRLASDTQTLDMHLQGINGQHHEMSHVPACSNLPGGQW